MYVLRLVLLVVHISSAALLLGAATGLLKNLRRTAEVGGETFRIAAGDSARRSAIIRAASMLTLLTGLVLIFMMGGFKVAPKNFHAALGNMLVATVVSVTMMGPSGAKIVAIAAKEKYEMAELTPLFKKLAMGQGILHALWLANLVLMLIRF